MMAGMRYFDVPQATQLIPFLDQTFTSVRTWTQRAEELTAKLAEIGDTSAVGAEIADPASPAGKLRTERDQLVEQIRQAITPVGEMGIEVKSLDGLVDFRALRGGRAVYLCWRFGETAITHWHELDTGFAGRQPIEDAGDFAPSYLS